ncbi:MAG: NAD-dependent deacylase [Candidatus Omnitrophota bacterium]
MKNSSIEKVCRLIEKGKVIALTGAGISVESGIPHFRGEDGLWSKYDPNIYANVPGLLATFAASPGKIVEFIDEFYSVLFDAKPNPAHLALAKMENNGVLDCVITQNIDNLHQDAGSNDVFELHGNSYRLRCQKCQSKKNISRDKLKDIVRQLRENKNSRIKLLKIFNRFFPKCSCGGRFRIDIVLFGEMLPQDTVNESYRRLDNCDVVLLIGTSGVVYPAAGMPLLAKEKGAKLVEINTQESELSYLCDYQLFGKAGEVFKDLERVLKL